MARLNVNPTRMELNKLKTRLKTATRGHKLLKDKTDEMIRRFSVIIKENKSIRESVENEIAGVLSQFSLAKGLMGKSQIGLAFSMPVLSSVISFDTKTIMNVSVPSINLCEGKRTGDYPYAISDVTSEADYSVKLMSNILDKLCKLAETEKTVQMLADEIEKGKRRVNALECVLIPNLQETIKYITMKLEENDRSSRTRLMKVKSMIQERQ